MHTSGQTPHLSSHEPSSASTSTEPWAQTAADVPRGDPAHNQVAGPDPEEGSRHRLDSAGCLQPQAVSSTAKTRTRPRSPSASIAAAAARCARATARRRMMCEYSAVPATRPASVSSEPRVVGSAFMPPSWSCPLRFTIGRSSRLFGDRHPVATEAAAPLLAKSQSRLAHLVARYAVRSMRGVERCPVAAPHADRFMIEWSHSASLPNHAMATMARIHRAGRPASRPYLSAQGWTNSSTRVPVPHTVVGAGGRAGFSRDSQAPTAWWRRRASAAASVTVVVGVVMTASCTDRMTRFIVVFIARLPRFDVRALKEGDATVCPQLDRGIERASSSRRRKYRGPVAG
jgi:hypothetical protein